MADLEQLNIIINGESEKAVSALDKLILKLYEVKTSMQALGFSNPISNALNIGGIGEGLADVASNAKDVQDALNGTTKVSEHTASATEAVARAETNVSEATEDASEKLKRQAGNFREAKDAIARYYDILTKISSLKSDVVDVGGAFVSESGKWDALASAANEAARHYENVVDLKDDMSDTHAQEVLQREVRAAENYGISLERINNKTKDVSVSTKNLASSVSLLGGRSNKLISTIKRVATMRLIRWALRELVKAIKEGLEILTEWDRTYGNNTSNAAKTVDELSSKWREVKKSVGAAIMPLIQILQPVLNSIMDGVIQVANAFNQILRSVQGFGTYMKATYTNVKKTTTAAKELHRVLFGFDQLNVLNGSGGTGATISVSPIEFKEVDIESKLQKIGENIKKYWDKIKGYFSAFSDDVKKIFGGLIDIIEGLFTGDLGKVWEGVKKTFKGLLDGLAHLFEGFIKWGKDFFEPIITFIAEEVIRPISDAISEAVGWITEAISTAYNWVNDNIIQPIVDFFDGIFSWIDENIVTPVKNFIKKINDWFREHPALAKFFGIEPIEDVDFDVDINIETHTKLSGDTKKLYELVSIAKGGGSINVGSSSMNVSLSTPSKNRMSAMFASGGDPDMGSLFWAGESGAEIVANTPSGTGVMNMKQMQDAVSNGNVQVVNAIGAMTNVIARAIADKDTNAYLDGQKITDTVIRRANGMAKATGRAVLSY